MSHLGSDGQHNYWQLTCECGNMVKRCGKDITKAIRLGERSSCGCKNHKSPTHLMTKHPLYAVWRSMKQRCMNPQHKAYANYGGRGISLDSLWLSFENFRDDMLPSYKPGLTLDRIDVNGGYSRANCRWATYKEQARNKQHNTYVSGHMTVAEAAEKTGIGTSTIFERIKRGWKKEHLLIEPEYTTLKTRVQDRVLQSEEKRDQ